jgi:hypothetical protein
MPDTQAYPQFHAAQPPNRYDFALKVIFQYGFGTVLAGYLAYNLVQVFLPALISEMKGTNLLILQHVTSQRVVEEGIPVLINISTQDCVNNASNQSEASKCFRVASGEQPSR